MLPCACRNWQYAGSLFSQLSQNFTEIAQCVAVTEQDVPMGTKGFGGTCDQFGTRCRMVRGRLPAVSSACSVTPLDSL